MTAFTQNAASHCFSVYEASDFRVISGANEGDGISFADDLVMDDIYRLDNGASLAPVTLRHGKSGEYSFEKVGTNKNPQSELHLDCMITLMGHGAHVSDAFILVDVSDLGHVENVYLLPLEPLRPDTDYHLIGIDRRAPIERLSQLNCVSFGKGTRITLACGTQRCIEDLSPGDAVLTRDDGVQLIRSIGLFTQRAQGAFAPVRITSGALNNARDLCLSPNHRLFRHHETSNLGSMSAKNLVKARTLVNGTSVKVEHGGFIDYYQLLFDRHQIVYAEGIAAETMLIDAGTSAALKPARPKNNLGFHMSKSALANLEAQPGTRIGTDKIIPLRAGARG